MLVSMKNMAGNQVGEVELSDEIFATSINNTLMHQALVRQLANARLGTHKTKGRSEVRGGGRKPWRQKGTGRARQGSTRSPNWVGGGTVFGPTPRKYTKSMPRKMRRSALRSALSAKAAADQIVVIDQFAMDAPKTKEMAQMLSNLDLSDQNALIVLAEKDLPVQNSIRNLSQAKSILVGYLNIHDLLGHDTVLIAKDAVDHIEEWLSPSSAASRTVEADLTESAAEVEG